MIRNAVLCVLMHVGGFLGLAVAWLISCGLQALLGYNPAAFVDFALFATLGAAGMVTPLLIDQGLRNRRRSRRQSRRQAGLCVKCGYNLTGNESHVCPECGFSAVGTSIPNPEERQ